MQERNETHVFCHDCCAPCVLLQVMEQRHTFLDRQVLLLRACSEALSDANAAALQAAGLRGAALGRPDVACNPEVPAWLKKWAALTLEFVALERQLLPGVSAARTLSVYMALCIVLRSRPD